MMNKYIGHSSQSYGFEEHRLCGGKGDGMKLIQVNNGSGLMFTISADRAADISRAYYKGVNLGFFAPCGYVAPQYYDNKESGFLKSFTAGFFTTCGLCAVGSPCNDNGEELPLHGTISHAPAENMLCFEENNEMHFKFVIRDAALFSHKLILEREYIAPIGKNEIKICDKVKNIGFEESPYMILYHFNIGYPLLSEKSTVKLSHKGITPRNARAADGIENSLIIEKPQNRFEEQCYYYDMTDGKAEIYNPDLKFGLSLNYDIKELPFFTEWKMMGSGEYVLGLEPGNCTPDGRNVMREKNLLCYLKPGEEKTQTILIKIEE